MAISCLHMEVLLNAQKNNFEPITIDKINNSILAFDSYA